MSDAAQNLDGSEIEQTENEQVVESKKEDNKPSYEDLEKRLNSVLSKHDELLTETKKAKDEKRRIQEEQTEKEKRLAEKNGEYEKLWKTASQEKEQLAQQLKDMQNSTRQEKLNTAAMRIAAELADGHNAQILSKFVVENLQNISEDGTVDDDVIQAVTTEFKNNEMFKSLLRGSKATGGGAPGNMRSAQTKQNLTRAEFEKLDATKRMDFISKVRNGSAELTDN